jgi:ribosome-binding factor A
MSKKHEKRISDLVRLHICELIEREINDPRVVDANITVTDVEVTPDTRYAKIFFSLIGDDEKKADAQRGLNSASGFLSRELGKRLRTRNTPHISFEFDESLERGDRMEQLFDEIKKSEKEKAE